MDPLSNVLFDIKMMLIAGILDSGADFTVSAFSPWHSHWPLTQAAKGPAGVGGLSIPKEISIFFCQ